MNPRKEGPRGSGWGVRIPGEVGQPEPGTEEASVGGRGNVSRDSE